MGIFSHFDKVLKRYGTYTGYTVDINYMNNGPEIEHHYIINGSLFNHRKVSWKGSFPLWRMNAGGISVTRKFIFYYVQEKLRFWQKLCRGGETYHLCVRLHSWERATLQISTECASKFIEGPTGVGLFCSTFGHIVASEEDKAILLDYVEDHI